MKLYAFRFLTAVLLSAMLGSLGLAQGAGSSLTGMVIGKSGGVSGADISVKNNDTGAESKGTTADNGTFSIPALNPGTYTVTVAAPYHKRAVIRDLKLTLGMPGNIWVVLEAGDESETVVVGTNTQVAQSSSATIADTLNVSQIQKLPGATRNVMDLLVLLPGVNTPGIIRSSTVAGMPNNTVNITIDGINTQDNYLKGNAGGDGFFSAIIPGVDSVEEATISTAAPGAESAGNGAVQIRFVTRWGSNEYHGSVYEYHRNPDFNANYWFNNRDKAPTYDGTNVPCTAAQLISDFYNCKAPRDRVLLNQPGARVGGPITLPKKLFGPLGFQGKDKAFFFVNYEEFRLPAEQSRTRTILAPTAAAGNFVYTVGTSTNTVNILNLPFGNNVGAATVDPTIQKLLADIQRGAQQGTIRADSNPSLNDVVITNKSINLRRLATSRFDFNLTSRHRLEVTYSYHKYAPNLDVPDGYDPAFPGFPNQGSQASNRYSNSNTLRSILKPKLINEARFGLAGGNTLLGPDVNVGQFSGTSVANEDGYALGISAAMGITNAYQLASSSRRNTPTRTIEDTLAWTLGAHNLSFGGSFTDVHMFLWSRQEVPTLSFGVDTTADPARSMFDTTNGLKNFPGASSTQYGNAQNLYAVLTGRVTQIGGSGVLSEASNQYAYNGANVQRGSMRELGVFATDSWRVSSDLTVNYGVRWERQFPFSPGNSIYTTNTVDDLWGYSGHQSYGGGHLYTPAARVANDPTYKQFTSGTSSYTNRLKNLAPSLGIAWRPIVGGFLTHIFGDNGQTTIRGGASIAYNRNGMLDYSSIFSANPGITINATRNMTNANLVTNSGTDVLPVLLSQKNRLGPPTFPTTPIYPIQSTAITDRVNLIDPNLKIPYTMSAAVSYQRELSENMVLEIRLVGARNVQPWVVRNINEQNLVDNGFLSEFKTAMANLQANTAAGRGSNFRYYGSGTGTSPLPITLAYFGGVKASLATDPSRYTSCKFCGNFNSSAYINTLAKFNPSPSTYAANLWSTSDQRNNALNAGLFANEFVANPTVASGGAWFLTNGGSSRYEAAEVELRRRLARSLLIQANYTFAKEIDLSQASFLEAYLRVQGTTLPQAFKVAWIYELPFGSGRTFFGRSHGVIDHVIGGWEFQGTGRWQSGSLINFGNVRLVGMTLKDLRKATKLRFDNAHGLIYYEPVDIITNTIAAYNTSATSSTGYSSAFGVPSGRYIAPANSGYSTNACLQASAGDCAGYTVTVRGPRFQRFDISMVKRIRLTETKNLEFRGDFLNAFNNVNFLGVACASGSASCGQVTSAYTDISNTQDPGGRLIQLVLRINF